ncbi:Nn.00g004280.m01.CDS01 [Neocucurbitaria sp. VM-36]
MEDSVKKKEVENNPTTAGSTNVLEATRPRHRLKKFLLENQVLKRLCRPTGPWIPLWTTTLVVTYAFQLLEDHQVHLNGAEDFFDSCPEQGRRTQASAFVKLFAASVTTICIHGHLGSLTGSGNWKRELFRAVEVVISPCYFFFETATAVWYEFASLPAFRKCPWGKRMGPRYRLARMCKVRIESSMPSESNMYLGVINPVHTYAIPLRRDLKWSGRVLILVILLMQYVQAGLLLARRFLSDTAATVDVAMFLMVLSGLIALTQSLIISFINQSWLLSSTSSSNNEPCVAKDCPLPECVGFKIEQNLPNGNFNYTVFGYNIVGIPRTMLHVLAGGNLQWTILQGHKSLRDTWWQAAMTLFGQQYIWELLFDIAVYASSARELGSSLFDTSSPDGGHEAEATHTSIPTPSTAKTASCRPSYSSTILGAFLFVVVFIFGLVVIGLAVCAVLYHMFFFMWPCVDMYMRIVFETSAWKTCNATERCPQLWKDGLEDELWWF